MVNEIYRALRLDAVVQVGIGPAALNVQVGPAMGTNINCGNSTMNGQIM
jgi:hypothetical protein